MNIPPESGDTINFSELLTVKVRHAILFRNDVLIFESKMNNKFVSFHFLLRGETNNFQIQCVRMDLFSGRMYNFEVNTGNLSSRRAELMIFFKINSNAIISIEILFYMNEISSTND